MSLSERLKRLSQVYSREVPVLSLTLHYSHREARELGRVRIFLKNAQKALAAHRQGALLEADFQAVQEFLTRSVSPHTHGIALYASAPLKIFETFQFWAPLRDHFAVGPAPQLGPVIRVLDDYEPTLLVLVDSETARLYRISPEAVLEELIEGEEAADIPKRGFWGEARYQRRREEQTARRHKQVAEQIAFLWDAGRYANLILSGQERTLASFRELLPKRVQGGIIGTLKLSIKEKQEVVLKEAVHLIRGMEEAKSAQERQRLSNAGLLVRGWDAVAKAASEGRVMRLYFPEDARLDGWHCTGCDLLGPGRSLPCPVCGGGTIEADLADALAVKVEREGGQVDISYGMQEPVAGALRF
jgi:hypothetical protein